MSNGAMTLYTINPNVKTIADFKDTDRIAVPTVRLSFNAMMLQMAAEELWKDPHRLDHLTVALGHPDAVTALSAGYGKASITAHIAVQPFTDRGLKLPGAHIITDSRKVFGGPLTQITLLATKPTKEKNPTLFKAVANALDESIKAANADKRAAAVLWKEAQKAPDSVDDLVAQLNDPGFEFTSQPRRIAFFADFLNRTGTMKAKLGDWKELFWETAHQSAGRLMASERLPDLPSAIRARRSCGCRRAHGTRTAMCWARRTSIRSRRPRRSIRPMHRRRRCSRCTQCSASSVA